MPSVKNSPHFRLEVTGDALGLIGRLPLLVRGIALEKALKKAGNLVVRRAKQLCSVGQARVGVKADKKHLLDTIDVVFRDYRGGQYFLAVIGPQYPAGAHGHLVEFGHRNGINGQPVPPRPFMRPAFDETRSEQQAVIIRELERNIEAAGDKAGRS